MRLILGVLIKKIIWRLDSTDFLRAKPGAGINKRKQVPCSSSLLPVSVRDLASKGYISLRESQPWCHKVKYSRMFWGLRNTS